MNLGITRRFTTAGVLIAAAGSLAVATVTGAAGASQPPRGANQPAHSASAPHRQIGTAELTYFKVVLTATRGAGQPPTAVQTCSLNITETKGMGPVQAFDSAKVSLLATPALGCIQSFSERWKP